MLAYYVEWHLREAWAPILFHDHERAQAEKERASPVAAVEVSAAAKRKRASRHSDDGLPVTSFSEPHAPSRDHDAQHRRLASGPERHDHPLRQTDPTPGQGGSTLPRVQ